MLLEDGYELEGSKGAADFPLREILVQAAEDARVVAADVEDLVYAAGSGGCWGRGKGGAGRKGGWVNVC